MTTENTNDSSPMTGTFSPDALANMVKRLCLAESLGRIYSVNHPKGQGAVHAAFEAISPELEQHGALALSLSDGRILVAGQAIEERNPVVGRFVNAFQQVHVDNLLFSPGLTLEEFEEFFRVLLQGPKVINEQGGLAVMLKEKQVTHVRIQQVTFVMMREDETIEKRETQEVSLPPPAEPMDEENLLRHTMRQAAETATRKPARPRKPRARKPVVDTITKRLREGGVGEDETVGLARQLSEYFEREINVRTKELREDNRRLTDEIRDLNRVLEQMDLAVVVWNSAGVTTFVHHAAVNMVGLVAGRTLSAPLHECLTTLEFPLLAPEEALQSWSGLTDRDKIFLRAVESIIEGPDGQPVAALLRRG